MSHLNSNILLGIFVVIVIIAVIYYLSMNDNSPIKNEGCLDEGKDHGYGYGFDEKLSMKKKSNIRPIDMIPDNRKPDDVTGSLVDDLIAQYSVEDRPIEGGIGSFTGNDPMSSDLGTFNDYGKKRQLNFKKMEQPYAPDEYDPRDFSYKKKKFTKRTPNDVKELFDVNKMLPQEIEQDWFDVEPLLTTKKIRGTHLINPKVLIGVNTVQSSLRNGTHDIRGDIPNPKIQVSPWLNSTIEPDTNLKGICNPI